MEKTGSFDHFPKGTGCTPWFFRISANNKINCVFNNSGLSSKKRVKIDYNCYKIASERGNMANLEYSTFSSTEAPLN